MHEPSLSHSLSSFRLFLRYFQALAPPYARDTLVIDEPAVSTKKRRDPLVAVAAIPNRQFYDRGCQRIFIITLLRLAPLRRAMLTENTASPAFGNAELLYSAINTGPTARGRQKFPEAASFKIALSSSASASKRFSRAFSRSRSFSRLA